MVRLWDREGGLERLRFPAHERKVAALAVTADGSQIVSGGDDGRARLWDLDTGVERAHFTHWLSRWRGWAEDLIAIAITPDSQRIISADWNGTVAEWYRNSGRKRARIRIGFPSVLLVMPDGQRIVTTHPGNGIAILIYKIADPRGTVRIGAQADSSTRVSALAVTPDERRIIAGYRDGTVRMWDASSGEEVAVLRPVERRHPGQPQECADVVEALEVTPDGRRAVIGDAAGTLRVWNVANGHVKTIASAHQRIISTLAITPDGQWIVSGSEDGTIRQWDIDSGRERARFIGHTAGVTAVAVTPDGRRIVTGGHDRILRVWDRPSGREQTARHPSQPRSTEISLDHDFHTSAVITPDGQRIVSGSTDGAVRVWDLVTCREEACLILDVEGQEYGRDYSVWAVCLTPDGRRVVSGGNDGIVRVWEWETTSLADRYALGWNQPLEGEVEGVAALAVTPNGQDIVGAGSDGSVWLMDLHGGRQKRIGAHENWASAVAVTPDGEQLVSGGGDGVVRLWDLATGREQRSLTGHRGDVRAVAVSADGREIVTCGGTGGQVGRGLDVGDGTIRVWDRFSGRQLARLSGHTGGVLGVAITPDGAEIVSVGMDHTIRMWDRRTGRQVRGAVHGVPRKPGISKRRG